jgi:hypothetical protein
MGDGELDTAAAHAEAPSSPAVPLPIASGTALTAIHGG